MKTRAMFLCAFLGAFFFALSPLSADIILVPSQVSDLQAAIDLASPGDVVLIDGGTHGPVVVDIPLTLLGVAGNRPFFRPPVPGESGDAAIQLAGSGSGVVTLSVLDVGGTIDGTFFGLAHAGIRGTGFDEVRITHCEVIAPAWIWPTGIGDGGPAVDLDVPLLVVQDSTVVGGSGTDDGSGLSAFDQPKAGHGIDTTGDLVLHASTVMGGAGLDQVLFEPFCGAPCSKFSGGVGGTAIRADTLWSGSNTIAGGVGAVLSCATTPDVCIYPDGPGLDVQELVALPATLSTGGPIVLGQRWTLMYQIEPMQQAFMVMSFFPGPPVAIAEGPLFMDPTNFVLRILPASPSGLGALPFMVPSDPMFGGLTIVLQTWQLDIGLSAPVEATSTSP